MENPTYKVYATEYTEVKNIKGTSDNNPPTGYISWKEYWEDETGRSFGDCSNRACSKNAEVGAHVKKVAVNAKNNWYIVPLCKGCNNLNDSFEVKEDDLVRASD